MRIKTLYFENVLSEILDLGQLCHGEEDVRKVLELLVEKIARIMQTDVCSLYLIDPQTRELVLKATKGLNPESVDKVRLLPGEGLVGKTLEWLKPVSVASARKSKSFRYFPGSGEEKYSSFLSVPLIYNRQPIGVLAVQDRKPVRYSPQVVHLLMTLAIPAVSVVEKSKLLGVFGQISGTKSSKASPLEPAKKLKGFSHEGVGASSGIAIAPLKLLHRTGPIVPRSLPAGPFHADVEKMRLLEAIRWVEEEILAIQKKAKKKFGVEELSIFDAYSMVLQSDPFKQQILGEIDGGKSALQAVQQVIQKYTEELSMADDEYIRERIYDIHDLGRKIVDCLLYGSDLPTLSSSLEENSILLSEFWSISDFVEMDLEKTKGIISPAGGASSHIAILAKSLGIPAVLGLSSFTEMLHEGDEIVMDGSTGMVIVNPDSEVRAVYERESREYKQAHRQYQRSAHLPATPHGGKRITIGANMGILANAHDLLDAGAEEIGLYRTEFPFLARKSMPTEEEQFKIYKKVLQAMGKRPVTIRTLDIGGDKYLPYLNLPHETNPFLGWRSIRISLEREDLFRIQLRALFRASPYGRLRVLFPMIISLDEIRRVKEIVRDVKKELRSNRVRHVPSVPLGVMIEVPAAVEIADSLIREVDFFSIGTNDLIQYALAVDRSNPRVAKLFNPLHPSVLKMIHKTISAAHRHHKPVSVCGEMAGQPLGMTALVGMGIDSLSVSAPLIPYVKSLIIRLRFSEVKRLTSTLLRCDDEEKIRRELEIHLRKKGLEEFLPHHLA